MYFVTYQRASNHADFHPDDESFWDAEFDDLDEAVAFRNQIRDERIWDLGTPSIVFVDEEFYAKSESGPIVFSPYDAF